MARWQFGWWSLGGMRIGASLGILLPRKRENLHFQGSGSCRALAQAIQGTSGVRALSIQRVCCSISAGSPALGGPDTGHGAPSMLLQWTLTDAWRVGINCDPRLMSPKQLIGKHLWGSWSDGNSRAPTVMCLTQCETPSPSHGPCGTGRALLQDDGDGNQLNAGWGPGCHRDAQGGLRLPTWETKPSGHMRPGTELRKTGHLWSVRQLPKGRGQSEPQESQAAGSSLLSV